jgi:DNA-binding transcriptional MerR regulator
MADDDRYSLTELADMSGVTPRTVRYYLAQGLLPAVGPSGPGNKYDAGHLARLRLIRRLQAEHLPLAEIRHRLDALDDDEVKDLAGRDDPAPPIDSAIDYLRAVLGGQTIQPSIARPASPMGALRASGAAPLRAQAIAANVLAERLGGPYDATPATETVPPARPAERSQWERIVLAPDVELHIRRPLPRRQNKQVDRLVTIARELLEEDRP